MSVSTSSVQYDVPSATPSQGLSVLERLFSLEQDGHAKSNLYEQDIKNLRQRCTDLENALGVDPQAVR